MRHACPSSAPKPTCSICTSAPRRPGPRADSRARGMPLDLAGGQRTTRLGHEAPLARDRIRPDDPESRVVLTAGTVWGFVGANSMLIVPERGPSIPDARGWAISVLHGASRECEEHGWMRACDRDRHQYPPFDTSAGEASSEVGKVLDSSVPAGWSRMPFRPTGYFHPADSCGRKRANSCPQAPMPRPSASGRVQSGATERGFIC